jgi:hypothetical protein
MRIRDVSMYPGFRLFLGLSERAQAKRGRSRANPRARWRHTRDSALPTGLKW